jgi:hypothetical protein
MRTSFVLELHREWSEFADECIALLATVEIISHRRISGTHSPFLIAGTLKEFVAGGLRDVRALRSETAVKGQRLSRVIG